MIDVGLNYTQEKLCEYKGEKYIVRDNGAILRLPRDGKPTRKKDDVWSFGEKIDRGYAKFCGESVHRIVAYAFLGDPPTNQHVVDHIDTNRQNNRPENLRWLTKLENILLNPYTKAKIEYWCGSIESFLKDPSQLRGHESEDSNFSWMRAVTPEEARNTLANWKKLLSKPPTVSQYKENAISEWIFRSEQPVNYLNDLSEHNDLNHKIDNEISIKNELIPDSNLNAKSIKKEEVDITKKEFITAMMEICKKECLEYKKYYKSDNFGSDLFVIYNGKQFAFSVFKSINEASQYFRLMEKDGVTAVGFILSPRKDENAEIPCFGLHKTGEGINVSITDQRLPLSLFVKNVINCKIEHQTKTRITAVDVLFESTSCYSCKEPYSVYIIRYLVDENGHKYDYEDLAYGYNKDLQFEEGMVKDVKLYIKNHPEKNIVMGEIKERYSRTSDASYMSFGCPKCDRILGDHYLDEIRFDLLYETDEALMHRIALSSYFEIPTNVWKVAE